MDIAVVIVANEREIVTLTQRKHAKHDDFSHQLAVSQRPIVYLSAVCVCFGKAVINICVHLVSRAIFCGRTCIDRGPQWMDNGVFWQHSICSLEHAEPTLLIPSLHGWSARMIFGRMHFRLGLIGAACANVHVMWKIVTNPFGNFIKAAK